jgi:hypothetical protein
VSLAGPHASISARTFGWKYSTEKSMQRS